MLVLPASIAGLIGLHLYLVIRLGVTSPPWSKEAAGSGPPPAAAGRPTREGLTRPAPRRRLERRGSRWLATASPSASKVFKQYKEDVKERGKPFYPYAMLHDTIMSLVVVAVIIGLAVVWKWTRPRQPREHRLGLAREALRRARRPGHLQLRPAARLVLLLPLLPAADLQVARVGRPRHGRHPDGAAPAADRDAVHRRAQRAPPAAPAGGARRLDPRRALDGDPHLSSGATAKEALGSELLGAVKGWAAKEGFANNKQALAGATLFASLGCTNCHTYLGAGQNNLGAPDLTAEGAKNKGAAFEIAHLKCPSCVHTGSPMPSFASQGSKNLAELAAFLDASRGPH